jgi:hypothetical protein
MEIEQMTDDSLIQTRNENFTAICWQPPEDMEFDEWERVGYVLQQMDASLPWWIGDWLNYGEYAYGEAYTQAVQITGKPIGVLQNYKWVAHKIPPESRREWLSWSHHRAVATFAPEIQNRWLDRAENGELSVTDLQREIQQENMALLPPEVMDNGNDNHKAQLIEEELDLDVESIMPLSSPVRRLRYALKILIDRHLQVAPYDDTHVIVERAQRIYQETQHEENEDLNDE